MHKLTFTLKQHTPLIHFQHEQKGATLRASEVKPRLDRFLIQKFGGWDKIPKEWKIDNPNGNALEYKLSITTNGIPTIIADGKPLYFGNQGKEVYEMKKLISNETLNIIFRSKSTIIIEKDFQNLIKVFFETNNFGSRARKGFGSYSIEFSSENNNPDIDFLNKFYRYSFEVHHVNGLKDIHKVFRYIEIFGKAIRSGYNINGLYIKPVSFLYAKEKQWQWDKKSIKEKFLSGKNSPIGSPSAYSSDISFSGNKPFVRGVLGLATNQSWDSYKMTLNVEDKNKIIERYASPIQFKPVFINNTTVRVYFDWIENAIGIWGETFQHYFDSENRLDLTVPSKSEFNPHEFMNFIAKINPRNHLSFQIKLYQVKKKLDKDNLLNSSAPKKLASEDNQTLTNWIIRKNNLKYVCYTGTADIIGTPELSIFNEIVLTELLGITFINSDKVKAFFDSYNPVVQMGMLDSIFNQLNTQN